MNTKAFWEAKLRLALHDPPHKPFVLKAGTGGHRKAARTLVELIERILDEPIGQWYYKPADFAASGADRPVLNQPRGARGSVLKCDFTKRPLVTHPLMGDVPVQLPVPDAAEAKPHEVTEGQVAAELKALEALDSPDNEAPPARFAGADALERTFWWTWRAWRDNLSMPEGSRFGTPLWDLLPADSRCPDHSIWEHLRVTSALAFLGFQDGARHPWLLSVSVAPVQAFIRESRTFRDLWMSSFLISELAFAAMTPFIKRYGPDCILYPDLRGNARIDAWMRRHRENALPAAVTDPCTQAALIPDTFVVLAPQGPERGAPGDSHLRHLRVMAEESRESMDARWRGLCSLVERWMMETGRRGEEPPDPAVWRAQWERQIAQGPQLAWSAVKWDRPHDLGERVNEAESLRRRESLPAQAPHPSSDRVDADQDRIARRRARVAPWLSARIAGHYEQAREVFGAVNVKYLQDERGFDYPIVHHVLRTRHRLRNQSRNWISHPEPGEKCTTCGQRQALSHRPDEQDIDRTRAEARKFWRSRDLDPDETGAERLCAICSVKRFLVVASSNANDDDEAGLGPVLFGQNWREETDAGKLRVPFPSTSVVALQEYFAWAVESRKGADLLAALDATDLDRTNFPRALARLALAVRSPGSNPDLLNYDAQYGMPHTLDAEIRRLRATTSAGGAGEAAKRARQKTKLERVRSAAGELHKAFCKAHDGRPPDPRVAVVVLDADLLGRLILGDPQRIGAAWADVLHPNVTSQLQKAEPGGGLRWAIDAGWPRLLGLKRHMGPSVHAFITRALAVFANTIVPWVVEREYGGRLVYAGGDDVLAIAPGADALRLAARLQQLFSAPWVVDTRPREQPWSWRRHDWAPPVGSALVLQSEARRRFVVPMKALGEEHIAWPIRWIEPHCDPNVQSDASGVGEPGAVDALQGRFYPMLGRNQSLSAGIAYAHFKTDLRLLIDHARHLLDEVAKRRCGGGAVAVGHFARGGAKSEFAMPWCTGGGPAAVQQRIIEVVDGFRRGALPGRLPYRLRDLTDLALAESEPGRQPQAGRAQVPSATFLRGLLATVLASGSLRSLGDAVAEMWLQGFRLHAEGAAGTGRKPTPERAVDGLLFCRALAGSGEDR